MLKDSPNACEGCVQSTIERVFCQWLSFIPPLICHPIETIVTILGSKAKVQIGLLLL